jgi:hypothetical protein
VGASQLHPSRQVRWPPEPYTPVDTGISTTSADATPYAQEDAAAAAHTDWRTVANQLRPKSPRLATLMDAADEDLLASMHFTVNRRGKRALTHSRWRSGRCGRHVMTCPGKSSPGIASHIRFTRFNFFPDGL